NPISPSLKDEVMLKPDKLFNPDKEMLKFIFPSNVTEYQVEIYNASGSRIITLKEQGKPDNSLGWDGKNQDNQQVSNGIFICKIWYAAGNASKTINKLIGVFR
ncbi:T9SS type A sorting domain-containing protein, partial [Candidatus Poribacteria bacterium]|nr:T9SS type A sorting domain-containing protein [Candidatus Poribacteria bacterium]